MILVIPHQPLLQFATEIFQAVGAPAGEASIVAEHLVTANLMGYDTHGIIRIPQYVQDVISGTIRPGAPMAVEKETATTAVIDCGWNFGQVGGLHAIDLAISKARAQHTATVIARSCNHAGRLGAYTQRAAESGFLAIGVCNSPRHGHFVIPWGGREGRLATNPISFAAPNGSDVPLLADFSTAESSEGAIRLHRNMGMKLPDGWVVRADGEQTNDPNDFYGPPRGAILPFGGKRGYRGFALGLLVEILGGLMGGSSITAHQPGNGLAFIVVDISAFCDPDEFRAMMQELHDYIKSSPLSAGFDEVLLPGEPDFRRRKERMREGVPIDESTWEQICESAASVGVDASPLDVPKP
jgi:uncharacterized oxidoreductase